MQQKAEEEGIDWYACWPDLEEVVVEEDVAEQCEVIPIYAQLVVIFKVVELNKSQVVELNKSQMLKEVSYAK